MNYIDLIKAFPRALLRYEAPETLFKGPTFDIRTTPGDRNSRIHRLFI